MRKSPLILGIAVLLLLLAPATFAAGAADSITAADAVYQVHVTSVILDPEVYFPYETGTVTVELANSGNQTISLSYPNILENHFRVMNSNTYNTVIRLGPGAKMIYSFLISADAPDGTYFPLFTVSTTQSGSISYPFKIQVDSKNLKAIIADKPDIFSIGKKSTVNLSIVNPRNSALTNILITPQGAGFEVSPSQKFVSSLNSGSSMEIPFQVTPARESDLTFHVSYQNGDNDHTTDVVLPLNIGEDKKAAVPVVNNIEVVSQGSIYKITGDVSNVGITDAKSMVLTVINPAKAVEPYPYYAIGSLASDDFSSFELNFAANDLSSVPLQIQWKDADGNTFSTVKELNLRTIPASGSTGTGTAVSGSSGTSASTGSSTTRTAGGQPGGGSIFGFGGSRGGGISSFYPVIAGGIIVVIGIVLWIKRKWILRKFKKQ
jgi:hypothetical protein